MAIYSRGSYCTIGFDWVWFQTHQTQHPIGHKTSTSFLLEEMIYLLSIAGSARAHYLAPSLRNRKHASKICVLAFNRSIVVYLLLLHALVLTTTCAEFDKLMSVNGTGATLSMVVLGIRPLIHHYLRLVMGPANAVAPRRSSQDSKGESLSWMAYASGSDSSKSSFLSP